MQCLAPDDRWRGGLCCHFERGCVSEACSSGHFEYDFGSETCSSGGGGVGSDPEPYIASHHPIRNHKKHKKKPASPLCMRTHAQATLRKLCSSYSLIAVSTALMTLCVPRKTSSQACWRWSSRIVVKYILKFIEMVSQNETMPQQVPRGNRVVSCVRECLFVFVFIYESYSFWLKP